MQVILNIYDNSVTLCNILQGGSLCHTAEFVDRNYTSMTMTWVAPLSDNGDIEFR